MSSFIFFKIPYEGKIESVYKLLKDRDWISDISIKEPEKGIIFMKVPADLEEEVSFNQDIVIDEETNTKFGLFQKITESDFEGAQNVGKPESSNINTTNSIEEEKIKLLNEKNEKNIENYQKINEKIDSKINEFNKKEISQNNSMNSLVGRTLSYIPKLDSLTLPTSINLSELGKSINTKYKDPFDYFFSQNYLSLFFIFAIFCLILFRL